VPSPSHGGEGAPLADNDVERRRALTSDLDMLSAVLDETLQRQTTPQFVSLVERVRQVAGEDLASTLGALEDLDLPTASQLVRAFSMYFHLANVTEQTHRAREGEAR
jgi:phosphoenolpyruvate carboxylase